MPGESFGFLYDVGDSIKRGWNDLKDWAGETKEPPVSEYGGPVDQGNFQLPGAGERGDYWSGQAQGAHNRAAPNAAAAYAHGGGPFRSMQVAALDRLRRQMNGEESLSQGQFRQATDANMAQQRSMAASANPNNAAMMARVASQNMGRMGQGFAQNASQLGIQERNAAANAFGQMSGQARGQDQQNSQFNAGQRQQNSQFNAGAKLTQQGMNDQYGLGAGALDLNNAQAQQTGNMGYEQNETTRYGIDKGVPVGPTNLERVGAVAASLAPLVKSFGSDERIKTEIADGAPSADRMLDRLANHLTPATYSYKDQAYGKGPRLGVMAQDVERGGPAGKDLVGETQGVKTLDIPKSVSTALGLIGRLGERLNRIEGATSRTKQTTRGAGAS